MRSAGARPALHLPILLLVALVGCTPATPAPTSLGTLKIGVLVPFTESAIDSDIGASQRRAADLYLKLKGGKLAGREVQLVYNDESALDPATNNVRIQQFLEQDHVELLLGGAGNPAAYLLRTAAETAKVAYLVTNAGGNALTRSTSGCTPSCKSRLVFRAAPSSWQLSEPLGEWAAKNGQKDFSIVFADDDFGREMAVGFAEGLAKSGGVAMTRTAVPAMSGANWPKIIAALKAQPAKNVFAAFATDDAEGFVAAWGAARMRAAGYRLFGPGPLADDQVLPATKQAGLGIITAFPWSRELGEAENQSFVSEFKKAYTDDETGRPLAPDGYAVQMWDAMHVLEDALKATKGDVKATDAFIAALEAVSFRGPGGPFTFDRATHNPVRDIYIREVRASGASLTSTVIDKIAGVTDPGR